MRRAVRVPAALGLSLAIVGAGTAAQSPSPGPVPSPLPPVFDDTAIPATATPGAIVDPAPIGWDHVTIRPDGRTLTVAFWNGAEACAGLDRIEVTQEAGVTLLTPWVGTRVDSAGADCADIRQLYATEVVLPAPILDGGTTQQWVTELPPGGAIAEPGGPFRSLDAMPWEVVDLGPDGRTGWAFFTGGDPACGGFDHVAVDASGAVPALAVVMGVPMDPPELCTLIARSLRAAFQLPAPILLGGDPPHPG